MKDLDSEEFDGDLYKCAFYYAVGILSAMPYYEKMHPEEIVDNILQRAIDLLTTKETYD